MKAKDAKKVEVLRYLSAQIKNAEVDAGHKELTDEEIVKTIANNIKKLNESLEAFQKAARADLIDKTKYEIETLSVYLPEQMSDEDLEKEIDSVIAANPNVANPGQLIGLSVKKLTGKAENSRIASIVQKKLSK
jgi:hypothetical protein